MEPATLTAIGIFIVCYIFIATEKFDKAAVAMIGAAAVIMLGLIPYQGGGHGGGEHAAEAMEQVRGALERIDMNVIFLLVGMMVIVNILATTGIFEWVAVQAAQKGKGDGVKLMVLLMMVTALFSAFLDNVTTVILVAPVTILVTQILEIPTVPFLILEAMFSNIGGTATLVGDPPNIVIGSQTHVGFNDFLIHLGPVVLVIFAVILVVAWWYYRKQLVTSEQVRDRIMKAEACKAIIMPKRLILALPVFALVLAGFFLSPVLHIEPGIVALGGAFVMVLATRMDVHKVLEKVEWGTIFFFIGLFMLIGCLEHLQVFEQLGVLMLKLTRGNLFLTTLAILWFCAILSAIVDNIPLVIAMVPLVKSIAPAFAKQLGLDPGSAAALVQVNEPLYWAMALGACLGGNGTIIGASANVVITQIARKNKYELSFMQFAAAGVPVMILSVVISSVYLYLRYFMWQ